MATNLPGGDQAVLDIWRPRGRHKARVFQRALGLQQTDAGWLRNEAAVLGEAEPLGHDVWGTQWRLDVTVRLLGDTGRALW